MTKQLVNTLPELPERPRLVEGLSVFERSSSEIQIGLDPRHAVVVNGLPTAIVGILRGLDGSRTTSALLALAGDTYAGLLREVLTNLTAHGIIEDFTVQTRVRGSTGKAALWSLRSGRAPHAATAHLAACHVAVHGSGQLAVASACLLAASGIGHLDVRADGVVTAEELGCGYTEGDLGTPRRTAIASAVRKANPATRVSRASGDADLVVLSDAVVPAPEILHELVGAQVTHLPVRVREGTGIVGPLVVPGRSSCLRCADLHRTDRDACWPLVASQLAGQGQSADLSSIQATAALATGQVLRALTGTDAPPPTWNATLEIHSYDGVLRHRPWPPHPHCGCGAPAQAG